MKKIAQKRKTYSLATERSFDLARLAMQMTEETGQTVPRQTLLDALVVCAVKDKSVYSKALRLIEKS